MPEPPKPPSLAGVRALARGAAVACMVLPLLALGGWVLDVPSLRSVVPGLPPISPNSAVAFILCGASLWLLLPQGTCRSRRALGGVFAAAVLLFGATTLMQYITGKSLGVDDLLFRWTQWARRSPPSRPSVTTSSCFVLLGAALLLLERRPRPRVPWTDVLTVPALLSALLVSNAYVHGSLAYADTPHLYAHTGMGLLTAVLLVVLGLGVLCARPDRGLMARISRHSLGGLLARRLVPVALLGPSLLSVALVLLQRLGLMDEPAYSPLFSTLSSAAAVALVLLSAWGLDETDKARQRAAAALEASEARYRGLLETAADAVIIVDREGHLRFVNAQVEQVFGYRREELLGQPVEVLLPERLRTRHRPRSEPWPRDPRLLQPGTRLGLWGRRKDGTEVAIEASLSPFPTSEGPTITAILRDVTQREQALAREQRARAEAEEQRARLQAVLDNTPVGVLFVEPGTGAIFANTALREMLGRELRAEAGRQQYVPLLRHADGRPLRLEELPSTRALEGATVAPEEYLLLRVDGRALPLLASAAPVRDTSGQVRGAVVTLQDITARRELERLREEYVGLISHDLRNPLNNISLRAGLLRRALGDKGLERERALAEAVQQGARRMDGMIEELLESTRLEAGQVELHREPVDLGLFLEEVLERDVPPDERGRFTLEVAGALPPVSVDAARVERVVANLLTNALKYTPPRTPVRVRLAREQGRAVVSVEDAGPGLPPEEAARLFEKFYRSREGRKREGIGLGLYISRLIIEAHGGLIWVESEPGHGSTFSFSLPLEPTDARAGRPSASFLPEGGDATPSAVRG